MPHKQGPDLFSVVVHSDPHYLLFHKNILWNRRALYSWKNTGKRYIGWCKHGYISVLPDYPYYLVTAYKHGNDECFYSKLLHVSKLNQPFTLFQKMGFTDQPYYEGKPLAEHDLILHLYKPKNFQDNPECIFRLEININRKVTVEWAYLDDIKSLLSNREWGKWVVDVDYGSNLYTLIIREKGLHSATIDYVFEASPHTKMGFTVVEAGQTPEKQGFIRFFNGYVLFEGEKLPLWLENGDSWGLFYIDIA